MAKPLTKSLEAFHSYVALHQSKEMCCILGSANTTTSNTASLLLEQIEE